MRGPLALVALAVLVCIEIGAAQTQATGTVIAGTIVDGTSKAPVADALVSLSPDLGRTRPISVKSGTRGEFVFADVKPGRYSIWASKTGYIYGDLGKRIPGEEARPEEVIVKAGGDAVTGLFIPIWRSPVLSGTVRDVDGGPLVGVYVFAYREMFVAGHQKWNPTETKATDDRGRYRIVNLLPGRYVVGIRASMTSPSVFAPGLYHPEAATVSVLEPGDEMSGLDIRVPRGTVDHGIIQGRLAGFDPDQPPQIELRRAEIGFGSDGPFLVAAPNDNQFTFTGVPYGAYAVRAIPKQLQAPVVETSVVVDRPRVDNVVVTAGTGARLRGRAVPNGAPISAMASDRGIGTFVVVRFDDKEDPTFALRRQRFPIASDGTFSTDPLVPGVHGIRMTELSPGWRLDAVMVNGIRTANDAIVVGTADVTSVSLVFDRRPLPTVSGLARTPVGQPGRGLVVYVFPTDRGGWIDFGAGPRRLQTVVSGPDGAYTLTLPPGEYFVAVREFPVSDSWMGAPILEQLAKKASTVKLSYGDTVVLDLSVK